MDMDMHCYPGEILVESCGELLLVEQRRRPRTGCHGFYELIKVDVKVNKTTEKQVGSGERELVPVDDLGDRMQFLGNGCSTSWSGSAAPFFLKKLHLFLLAY